MSRTVRFVTNQGRAIEFEAREKGERERQHAIRVPSLGAALPALAPVGTPCTLFRDDGRVQHTKTRSTLAVLGGTPVIWLEEVSGAYAVARVRVGVDPSVSTWDGA